MEPQINPVARENDKPVLLYCGRQTANDADLVRQLCLATHLADYFRVVLMIPDRHIAHFPLLSGIEFLGMPDVSVGRGTMAAPSATSLPPDGIVSLYVELDPSVVIIEDYPFEPSVDARLGIILACSANAPTPPIVICSLLDPLCPRVLRHVDQERTARILNNRFHAVLVHADPAYSRLEEHFRVATLVRIPIHHCGFLAMASASGRASLERRQSVLLHVSGGVDERIVRTATEAHRLLWSSGRIGLTIAIDPADAVTWQRLSREVTGLPDLTLLRIPGHEIGLEMLRNACVVSPLTHHHMCEVLASGTPALFLIDTRAATATVLERASSLRRLGITALTDSRYLNGPTLASHLRRLEREPVRSTTLDFGGAATGADLVHELAARRQSGDGQVLGQP